jgi:hypothetical protein
LRGVQGVRWDKDCHGDESGMDDLVLRVDEFVAGDREGF